MLSNLANTLEALDPANKFYGLIGAVAALLLIASIIGRRLKRRFSAKTINLKS
jgi:hypothetical protein